MDKTYTMTDMHAAFAAGIQASSTSNPSDWFVNWQQGGVNNDSGVSVTYNTSLTYAYVFSAVSMISNDVASLPLNVYSVDDMGDKEVDNAAPAQWILNDEPNDNMDALTFRETLTSHVLLWGNAYAAIERANTMAPVRLIPLLPDRTEPMLDDNGRLFYRTWRSADRATQRMGNEYDDLLPRNVLHIKGLGWDGLAGHSVISLARNSWGLGMAAQKHGNKHFSQGARPSIALKTEAKLDQQTADNLLQRWEERHAGDQKPALLSHGLELQPFSMSNEDSQWLESRAFQRVEVAAWFKLPPHKIGDDSRISYNSIEAENRSYLNQTLKGWLKRWESECRRKLLTEQSRRNRSRVILHDTQDLISADIETQVDVLVKLRNAEIVNRDEVRRKLGWTSTEGGDDFQNPNTKAQRELAAAEIVQKVYLGVGKVITTDEAREMINASGADLVIPAPDEAKRGNSEETREPQAFGQDAIAAQRQVLESQLSWLLSTEANAVAKASTSKHGNFVDSIDRFYAAFETKVTRSIEPIMYAFSYLPGCECVTTAAEVASQHVADSKNALLEVAGYSDAESLADNVAAVTVTWPDRAVVTAGTVLQGG